MTDNIYGVNLKGTLGLLVEKRDDACNKLRELKKERNNLNLRIEFFEKKQKQIQEALNQLIPTCLAAEVIDGDDACRMDLYGTLNA